MANLVISNRLKNSQVQVEDLLPWSEIAKSTYLLTYKPYLIDHEVVLSFCEAEEIQALNKFYRNIDEITDVLSFNTIGNLFDDLEKFEDLKLGINGDCSLGDIVICFERATQQAKEAGHSLKDELHILFIHGLLHLGFDHQSEEEAAEMFGLQDKIFSGNFKIQTLL